MLAVFELVILMSMSHYSRICTIPFGICFVFDSIWEVYISMVPIFSTKNTAALIGYSYKDLISK